MRILPRPVSPRSALADLRQFMARRQRHELMFAALSVGVTTLILLAFIFDTNYVRPYQREIIYVRNYDNPTPEQKRIEEMIDAHNAKVKADYEKARKARQRELQELERKVGPWL